MTEKRKIAVMMTVHKNAEQVNRLINHLSKDFDIYVHIDRRSSLKISESESVFVYKKYNSYWGSFNQIMATLFLLKQAYNKGYHRYLLISGQDLPIEKNEEILDFFSNNNSEYLHIAKIPTNNGWPDMNRLTKYHIKGKSKYYIIYCLKRGIIKILNIIKTRKLDYDFYGGTNWINLTHNCVKKIFEYLKRDKKYINRYKWTNCSDEIFYHTIINLLEGLEVENESLRYINWADGPEYPRTLRTVDYDKIMNSNKLFARKFDVDVDKEIIEMIYKEIEY